MFLRMGTTVAVAGASGYAGGELLRLLPRTPSSTWVRSPPTPAPGERLGSVHPHLVSLADRVLAPTDPAVLAEADLVFLALPHGQSAAVAAALPPDLPVVDLGADHRLVSADAWAATYGETTPAPGPTGCPSCPASARHRRRQPGRRDRVLCSGHDPAARPADRRRSRRAGRRGGRRRVRHLRRRPSAKGHLLGSEVMGDLSPYSVGRHRHVPEILQATARPRSRSRRCWRRCRGEYSPR